MNDYLMEKIIMHPDIDKLPVVQRSNVLRAFQDILEEIEKENPYATLQSILELTADDE